MNLSYIKYVPLVVSCAKSLISHTKHDYKVKTYDKTKDKIDTIEHLLIKLEKKISDCRNEIDDLRHQVMVSKVINLILSMLIIALILFLR